MIINSVPTNRVVNIAIQVSVSLVSAILFLVSPRVLPILCKSSIAYDIADTFAAKMAILVRISSVRAYGFRFRLWRLCFLLRALKILFNSVICESQVANLRVEL